MIALLREVQRLGVLGQLAAAVGDLSVLGFRVRRIVSAELESFGCGGLARGDGQSQQQGVGVLADHVFWIPTLRCDV